jgi:nickel/cobalt transporter (NiCoT) family protein
MDTADGAFMSSAYSWAFSNPVRKVFYNLTMTGLSVFVALFVGLIEVTQLVAKGLGLSGGLWTAVAKLDFGVVGIVIVVAFVVSWVGAFAFYRAGHVEERWSSSLRT